MKKRKDRQTPHRRGALYVLSVALSVVLWQGSRAEAATLLSGFSEALVAASLSAPTAMAFAPDGRLFVCQQGGALRVIKDGALLPNSFVTVNVDPSGERGLLGIAFDPAFGTNGFVYLYYTVNTSPRHNRVVRFRGKGDTAVPGSETLILQLNDLSASNHNGGALHFGPDGKLYVAVGENANGSNSQTLSNLLGKILRINPDGTIPTDNPFFTTATGQNRAIWALGLRNPYTFAFQPGSSRMFINDVGQSTWEEINDGIAGSNYGWPETEGPTTDPRFRSPIFAYGRSPSSTGGCAITGGTFYNPPAAQFPASYVGKYFFADYCSGWIRVLDPANNTAAGFAEGIDNPVDLQVAADGTLYYLARGGGGQVFRIQHNAAPPPVPTSPPNNNFANAQTLLGSPGQIGGRNSGANKETAEPNHGGDMGGHSVWYSWTAPASGLVTFDTRGSGFDTLLAIYQGNSVGVLTLVGSNDDISSTNLQSSVAFSATAGMVYRIAVDGFRGVAGMLELRWSGTGGRSDINLDGHGDLIWQNNANGQRAVWFMNGTTRTDARFLETMPTQWQIAGTGDFNRDGKVDLVWENTSTGHRAIWLMNGTTRVSASFLPTAPPQWRIAGTGDFNTDGHLDLVWQHTANGQRAVWFMNGTTRVSALFLPAVPIQWQIAGAGDFDRDGQFDLVWQDNTNGQRAIWLMNGTTRVGVRYLPTIATEWKIAGTGEFNGDGQVDLIWQNNSTGGRAIWLMNGATLAASHSLPTIPTQWEIRNH